VTAAVAIQLEYPMFIRDCWYVAAWDHEVSADGLLPRTLLGDPVLLYRGAQGQALALENRCCHRGSLRFWRRDCRAYGAGGCDSNAG